MLCTAVAACAEGSVSWDPGSWNPTFDATLFQEPTDFCEIWEDGAPPGADAVYNAAPQAAAPIELREGPLLGSIEGPVTFGDVGGADFFGDGALAILDSQVPAVVRVDLEALDVFPLAGPGDGPGEFRRIEAVARIAGNRLVVAGGGRVAIFGQDGTVEGTWQIPGRPISDGPLSGSMNGRVVDATDDGTLLVAYPGPPEFGTEPPPGSSAVSLRDPDTLVWVSPDGVGLGSGVGALTHPSNSLRTTSNGTIYSTPTPFDAAGAATASGGRAYVSDGRDYRITSRSVAGDSVTHILVCGRPDTLSAETIREYVRDQAAQRPESVVQVLRNTKYPAFRPGFGSMVSDAQGHVWAEDRGRADPGWWSVFAPDGTWLYGVRVPEGRILAVADTSLAVVVDLALGAEAVRLYSFTLPPS